MVLKTPATEQLTFDRVASEGLGNGAGATSWAEDSPLVSRAAPAWRPVQYLGSKLRSLEAVSQVARELLPANGAFVDAFSGTSVVSQRMAFLGARVSAIDASPAAACWARAMLGVGLGEGQTPGSQLSPSFADFLAMAREESCRRSEPWTAALAAEEDCLRARDASRLTALDVALPQVWRDVGATPMQASVFSAWRDATASGAPVPPGLTSAVFAGTYLGLRQALDAEGLLWATHALGSSGAIGAWTRDAFLTLICHALSGASYSPGKHFAQPHKRTGMKDLSFHGERLLSDRAIDLFDSVEQAANKLVAAARPGGEGHAVIQATVEDISASDLPASACFYADPPYTAQQYSRFYHVLDLAVGGRALDLQRVRTGDSWRVTSGLYAKKRFLSAFCRIATAGPALRKVVGTACQLHGSLLLSYSGSRSGLTGNRRLISMDEILDIVGGAYGSQNIEVRDVSVSYRPFRSESAYGKDDREFLVIARAT